MLTKEQKGYLELRDLIQTLQRDQNKILEEFRQRLAKDCNHPEELVEPYEWEHDNGYGRQSRMEGRRCTLCRFVNLWNRPGKYSWSDPSTFTYD